ncbi:MAG: hypothetical protein ACM3U2_15345 [Deltaproteobacteria bacterium]
MCYITRMAMRAGVFLAGMLVAMDARAQVAVTPVAVSPWFVGGASYGGGTVEGNFLFGAAQVIRAEGDYNLQTTQAMINYEIARSKYIENANKWTQAYFQMREANQAFQIQKMERNRHSPETLAQVAASELPRRLSSDELDPVTGKITWPEVLMDDQYASLRIDLEHQFGLRAWTSRTAGTAAQIHDDTRIMMDILRSNIENMPASDFIAARKFIDALDYAVVTPRRPVQPPEPASAGG